MTWKFTLIIYLIIEFRAHSGQNILSGLYKNLSLSPDPKSMSIDRVNCAAILNQEGLIQKIDPIPAFFIGYSNLKLKKLSNIKNI